MRPRTPLRCLCCAIAPDAGVAGLFQSIAGEEHLGSIWTEFSCCLAAQFDLFDRRACLIRRQCLPQTCQQRQDCTRRKVGFREIGQHLRAYRRRQEFKIGKFHAKAAQL